MCQKAIPVNRGQEYQTLITVRPSEHWCKMQRISLNGFWDIMFTGMGQMDRPHETQHLLPQPSQERRQERLKEPFNRAASVNFTSKKSCKNTNENEYWPICRYFLNGSIYAGHLVTRTRTRPKTSDRLPRMWVRGDKDTTTIWWVQQRHKQSEWAAVRFRCWEGLSPLGLTGLSSWVTKVHVVCVGGGHKGQDSFGDGELSL